MCVCECFLKNHFYVNSILSTVDNFTNMHSPTYRVKLKKLHLVITLSYGMPLRCAIIYIKFMDGPYILLFLKQLLHILPAQGERSPSGTVIHVPFWNTAATLRGFLFKGECGLKLANILTIFVAHHCYRDNINRTLLQQLRRTRKRRNSEGSIECRNTKDSVVTSTSMITFPHQVGQ